MAAHRLMRAPPKFCVGFIFIGCGPATEHFIKQYTQNITEQLMSNCVRMNAIHPHLHETERTGPSKVHVRIHRDWRWNWKRLQSPRKTWGDEGVCVCVCVSN